MSLDKIVRSIKALNEKEQMAVYGFTKGLEVAEKGDGNKNEPDNKG